MFRACPKCRRPLDAKAAPSICPGCGLVFAKYLAAQRGEPVRASARGTAAAEDDARWWERFVAAPPRVETWIVALRIATYAVFLAWGWRLWAMDIRTGEVGGSFMHAINLVFHEAGHVVFWPLGNFLMIAGGTLMQWLMPVAALVALHYRNRDNFGASLALWWLAISVIDAAPYAYDALHPQLVLLGGHTGDDGPHDWIEMLGDLRLLSHAQRVGHLLHWAGFALLLLANVWGALVLRRQWRNRTSEPVRDEPQ
jgi:hypothetical protein